MEEKEKGKSNTSGLESILDSLFQRIRDVVSSETIVGKPITVGKACIIPLSKLKIGFMAGSRSEKEIGASGGAISVEPIGLLVITDEGQAVFHSTSKPQSALLEKAINLIPDIAEKVLPEIKQRLKPKTEEEKLSDREK